MNSKKILRPKRTAKPNPRFLDNEVWCNESISSLPSPTPPIRAATTAKSPFVVALPALPSIRKETVQQPSPTQSGTTAPVRAAAPTKSPLVVALPSIRKETVQQPLPTQSGTTAPVRAAAPTKSPFVVALPSIRKQTFQQPLKTQSGTTAPVRAAAPTKSPLVVALPSIRKQTVQQPLPNQIRPKNNNGRNSAKKKPFIRFRFQIDCAAAVDLDVDRLVGFLKQNMKIDKKKNNLANVTIEKRSTNIHILAKVMLKKKYLKRLVKQYLRTNEKASYRVLQKNRRSYKVVLKM